MLARLNYIMGDHVEAMSCQQKAVLMSERVNGNRRISFCERKCEQFWAENFKFVQILFLTSHHRTGIDHPYTITEYTHLALYCFANTQVSTALKLLYR